MDRDRLMSSHQRLKTMVRRHIDQTIRMRSCEARNERIETGVSSQESQEESQRWKDSGRMQSAESNRTVFKGRLLQFQPRK